MALPMEPKTKARVRPDQSPSRPQPSLKQRSSPIGIPMTYLNLRRKPKRDECEVASCQYFLSFALDAAKCGGTHISCNVDDSSLTLSTGSSKDSSEHSTCCVRDLEQSQDGHDLSDCFDHSEVITEHESPV